MSVITEPQTHQPNNGDIHIFDELKPLPVYYSERSIYVFSVIFGVFFGSVLMNVNLKHSPSKKGTWAVIIFGIAYTAVEYLVLNALPSRESSLTFAINIGGAAVLRYFFWIKYIGKDTLYSKKPIWIPLIIGIVLLGLVIIAIISYDLNLI